MKKVLALFLICLPSIALSATPEVLISQLESDGSTSHSGSGQEVTQVISCEGIHLITDVQVRGQSNDTNDQTMRVDIGEHQGSTFTFGSYVAGNKWATSSFPYIHCEGSTTTLSIVHVSGSNIAYPTGETDDVYDGGDLISGAGTRTDLQFTLSGISTVQGESTVDNSNMEAGLGLILFSLWFVFGYVLAGNITKVANKIFKV
jgi:hypothetical protein